MRNEWLTNDLEIGRRLRAADEAYERTRNEFRYAPLATKVCAYRDATNKRRAEWEAIEWELSIAKAGGR